MFTASFANSYAQLPERLYVRQDPVKVRAPSLIKFNASLGLELGLDLSGSNAAEMAGIFSGNQVPANAIPLAMAYAGHQFGNFVPQLGDGRAILLGDVTDHQSRLRDIQLKGAGRTPFSRNGDGRAALGPVLREYIVSEAMHALGIPSTRALAAVTTGEFVYREDRLPGAILTRVASSHLRVGTFEYFAVRDDVDALRHLADYAISRHYPSANESPNKYQSLLAYVIDAQASLIAKWMQVGFIHGVMNTDNMTISGETIDFGPCAFMEQYDPKTVFSAIDQYGRYAFSNQPKIAQWNLARFAETLLPIMNDNLDAAVADASTLINEFPARFQQYWLTGMRQKLGLERSDEHDINLINDLLALMFDGKVDYTICFRTLCDAALDDKLEHVFKSLFAKQEAITAWLERWKFRLEQERVETLELSRKMKLVNPAFIPRNHRVEQMIVQAVETGKFDLFEELLEVIKYPFTGQPAFEAYARPAMPDEQVHRTYCGT